jgi:DNA-directed RNA polymerase specialized sigma24 family protein
MSLRQLKERKKNLFHNLLLSKQRKAQAMRLMKEQPQDYKTKWMKYYDGHISYYQQQLNLCNRFIAKGGKRSSRNIITILVLLIILIGASLIALFIIFPELTDIFKKTTQGLSTKLGVLTLEKNIEILEETITQYPAVLEKPVKWKKQFTTNNPTSFILELPKNSENIKIKKIQAGLAEDITSSSEIKKKGIFNRIVEISVDDKATEYEIEYETPAPQISEQNIDKGKRITVISPEGMIYENVLAFTHIPETLKKGQEGKIKAYKITEKDGKEIREETSLTAYDTNENNILDFVEFIAETGIYEIVFITKAEHLDENKNFISDIYPEVFELDNTWSEPIYNNEYIRVTFEIPLDNTRDITLYARNPQQSNTIVEVYYQDGEKITEFPVITEEKYYTILLTDLIGIHKTFDLKIRNLDEEESYLEFDHIIDPQYTTSLYVDGFNPISQDWTEIGTSPWLNATDGNYLTTDNRNNAHEEFTFENLPAGSIRINEVMIYAYLDCGTERIQLDVWDGTNWEGVEFQGSGWQWHSSTLTGLDTVDKVNNALLMIRSRNIGKWEGTVQADAVYLFVNYTTNSPPQITYVSEIQPINPIEASYKTIQFNVTMYDDDGVDDLNDTSVQANFTRGNVLRQNLSCEYIADFGNSANYTCSIDLQYWDTNGTWNITVYGEDLEQASGINDTTSFQYNVLKAIVITPPNISFPSVLSGETNITALDDPTIINNTGNFNATGQIAINALNLHGENWPESYIDASYFSIDLETWKDQCSAAQCVECDGTFLSNGTNVTIAGVILEAGDLSLGGGIAQEELYYCIAEVPPVSTQIYSTKQAGSWIITVLAALFAIKKKKRSKKKTKIKSNNSIKALNLLSLELKEDFSKEKQQIISLLIKQIKKKYRLNNEQISELTKTKKKIEIPLNIFSDKLEALEAISKYMKENLNLSYHEIAKLLNRDDRTIWTSYNRAVRKQPKPIKVTSGTVPFSIFKEKLTILEAIIVHLKKQMKYIEIAKLLSRDQRNIWTIYSRAARKIKRKV